MGGGVCLTKFCDRHVPEATITVAEIDPHVIGGATKTCPGTLNCWTALVRSSILSCSRSFGNVSRGDPHFSQPPGRNEIRGFLNASRPPLSRQFVVEQEALDDGACALGRNH